MSDHSNPAVTAPVHGSHADEHATAEAHHFDVKMWAAGAIGLGAGLLIAVCFALAGRLG